MRQLLREVSKRNKGKVNGFLAGSMTRRRRTATVRIKVWEAFVLLKNIVDRLRSFQYWWQRSIGLTLLLQLLLPSWILSRSRLWLRRSWWLTAEVQSPSDRIVARNCWCVEKRTRDLARRGLEWLESRRH
jgi:hypothetical protein